MAILSRQPFFQPSRTAPMTLGGRYVISNQNIKHTCSAVESLEPVTALETVHVRVQITLSIAFGEHLCLAGSCEELGSWNVENAPKFQWTHGDVWVADVELPSDTRAEFKIVHVIPTTGVHIWEYTSNRILEVPSVNEMKDGQLSLTWCDESMDATIVKPVQMSSLASWDEVDDEQSAAGPFAPVLDFFVGEKSEEIYTNETNLEDSVVDLLETAAADEEVEDLLESKGDIDTHMEPNSEDISNGTLDIPVETQEDIVPEEVPTQTSSSLKKAATAAGMVAAGVAGAALLSGLAVDVADTAVLGAFAVAAGSAAFGTKPAGKKGKGESADLEGDEETADKALSKEPGTIIAAGLAAAFDQAKGKNTEKEEDDTAAEE